MGFDEKNDACGLWADTFPDCRDCLLKLASSVAEMSGGNAAARSEAEKAGRAVIEASLKQDLTSPELANRMLREIRKITSVRDPYLEYKKKETMLKFQE